MGTVRRFISAETQTGTGQRLRAGSIRLSSLLREDLEMSRVIKHEEAMVPELELTLPEKVVGMLPVAAPIIAAVLLILVRIEVGRPVGFIYSDALVMLALISYICA